MVSEDVDRVMIAISNTGAARAVRRTAVCLLAGLSVAGCSQFLEPTPLNKTASIVTGTQVARGPSSGRVSSGFANTGGAYDAGGELPLGEPFGIDALGTGLGDDSGLPELGEIDFGAEQQLVSGTALPAGDDGSAAFFISDIGPLVYFDTDSSELTDAARETLRRQAAWLGIHQGVRITVAGHADERGTREYNLALGDRRASATRGYLIALGIDESRVDKISFGKERPVALGSSASAWAQNRRTETTIDEDSAFSGLSGGVVSDTVQYSTIDNSELDTGSLSFDSVTTGSLDSTPVGTITYDAAPLGGSEPVFIDDSGSVSTGAVGGIVYDSGPTLSPTVFDAPTVRSSPTPTRIEDVSVDDLLRDPSLIDRIGTTPATGN